MGKRLDSLMTMESIVALQVLQASPDGPELVALAFRTIDTAVRRAAVGLDSDVIAATARIAFAGYPGFGPMAPNPDGSEAWPPMADRAKAVKAACHGAVKRAVSAALADRDREEVPTDDETLSAESDRATVTQWQNPRDYPTDAITRTGDRTRLAETLARADVPPAMVRAIANPAETRQATGAGGAVNRTAVARAAGLPLKGSPGTRSLRAVDSALAELRGAGRAVLFSHGAGGQTGRLPFAPGAMVTRPDGTRALPATAPMVPGRGFWPGVRDRAESHRSIDGRLAPVESRGRVLPATGTPRAGGPVACGTGQAVWHRTDRGPVYSVGPVESGRPGRTVESAGVPVATLRVAGRVEFLAPDGPAMAGGFVTSARPVPGVPFGAVYGPTGAKAGQGKAVRPSAPRKRKRDGGIGSPMI